MATVIVVAVLLALGLGRGAHAATLTVVNTSDSGAGSLRQAIADAAPGDTIDFAPALSGQTITLTTGELVVSKNLTITGPAGGISVNGNNSSRVFAVREASGILVVSISNLTITGGNSDLPGDGGGGVLDFEADLTLNNVVIKGNNSRTPGGGVYNTFGVVHVNSSLIAENTAGNVGGGIFTDGGELHLTNTIVAENTTNLGGGGGIYILDSVAKLIGSTVRDNQTDDGGGILNIGTLDLTDTTVSGNVVTGFGGGIRNLRSATLTGSTVSENSASDGGGIFNTGSLTLKNSTVSGNTGSGGPGGFGAGGGGIFNDGASVNLTSTTISHNWSPQQGAAFYSFDGGVTFTSSIVASQDSGPDCSGTVVSLGYNLASDGSCSLTATGDLPNTNPLLAPLALNPPGTTETHALQPGSPAIDHIPPGVNGCGTTVSTDQRGVSRPQGGGCDVGAYESPPTTADQCRHGGWQLYNFPAMFHSQGRCIRFVVTGRLN